MVNPHHSQQATAIWLWFVKTWAKQIWTTRADGNFSFARTSWILLVDDGFGLGEVVETERSLMASNETDGQEKP